MSRHGKYLIDGFEIFSTRKIHLGLAAPPINGFPFKRLKSTVTNSKRTFSSAEQ